MPLFACTIFTSAFLLFLVQPIVAKEILPWFGGSAAVWTTCLVFFQVALLAGYTYSDFTTRRLTPRVQATAAHRVADRQSSPCCLSFPTQAGSPPAAKIPACGSWGCCSPPSGCPTSCSPPPDRSCRHGSRALIRSAPFTACSRCRTWPRCSRSFRYPFAIEPWITTAVQAGTWSIGYAVFALLCAATRALQPAQVRRDRPRQLTAAARMTDRRRAAST